MNKRQMKKRIKEMNELLEQQQKLLEDLPAESREAEFLDRLQRKQAEFENFRKRSQREKESVGDHVQMNLLGEFLDLCDNLDQAVKTPHGPESEEVAAYRKGMEMIVRQFRDFLDKKGVEVMEVEGQEFNPNFHEAMLTVKGDEEQSGLVAEELRKGYMYKDKVLRPARVSVYE